MQGGADEQPGLFAQPVGQLAGMPHANAPHVTSQLHALRQTTPSPQLPMPLHLMSHAPELHEIAPLQLSSPSQVTVVEPSLGPVIAPWHEPSSMQLTVRLLVPEPLIPAAQVSAPVQLTVQLVASPQSTGISEHAPSVVHSSTQGTFGGQLHAPKTVHVTTHAPAMHVPFGQLTPSQASASASAVRWPSLSCEERASPSSGSKL